MRHAPVSGDQVRWRCSSTELGFSSTRDVEPIAGIVGQPLALESLRFGLETRAPGQNVFVRGLTGTGRMGMVERLLGEMQPVPVEARDRCYVHNFSQPDRPRLLNIAGGRARYFRDEMRDLTRILTTDLAQVLNAKQLQAARAAIQSETEGEIQAHMAPLEAELAAAGLALVRVDQGQVPQAAIVPLVQGQPVGPEQLDQLIQQGAISLEDRRALTEKAQSYLPRLPELGQATAKIFHAGVQRIQVLNSEAISTYLRTLFAPLRASLESAAVDDYLEEVCRDVIEQVRTDGEVKDVDIRYGVNILLEQPPDECCPIVIERSPTLANLLGTIEAHWSPSGASSSDYRSIRSGSVLRADGGYLILDAGDVLAEPGAWRILMRTLRSRCLEIVPQELSQPLAQVALKPDAIPIDIRVILVGDAGIYHQLESLDRDFAEQFKVLADFDTEVDRNLNGVKQYAGVLARIARDEGLPHFDAGAVASLAEHGARIASRGGKLTARFGRIADIAREAAFLTTKRAGDLVSDADVREAVKRTRERASLPSSRFQSFIQSGTIRINTTGKVAGQVNGLAVMTAGQLTYGFPARITATVGPGRAGVIDIESRADMSGSIHTKGFHILGGLLRHLLGTDHPLTFSASLAFEQSYGGIDGDSASGAETCCLLSALTGIPLHQSIAMTGAIDQHGHIQAIGGVNEKVEGFFDVCHHFGLTGEQGVIIPASNAGDLMLRTDVADACVTGEFRIYAVERIEQALEIFTDQPAGTLGDDGYPQGSLLAIAVERAEQFWRETLRAPAPEDI